MAKLIIACCFVYFAMIAYAAIYIPWKENKYNTNKWNRW